MSLITKKYDESNYMSNIMGIPPHDYIDNTYVDGNLTQIDYYYGGNQTSGENVARIVLTYDESNNLLTVERTI